MFQLFPILREIPADDALRGHGGEQCVESRGEDGQREETGRGPHRDEQEQDQEQGLGQVAQGHLKGGDQQVSQPHLEAGQQREGPAGHAGGDDEGRAVAAVHGQGAAAHEIGRQDHDLVPLEEQGARGQDQQAGGDAHPEIGPEGAEEGEVGAVPLADHTVGHRVVQGGTGRAEGDQREGERHP